MCGKAQPFPWTRYLRRGLRPNPIEGRHSLRREINRLSERQSLYAHQAAKPPFRLLSGINSTETIARILDECRTIAVVGLSSQSFRPSHGVAAYMQRAGYRVIPVNPNETEVLEEKAYALLAD